MFEFTNRGENAMDVFRTIVKEVKQLPGMFLGIGTIMNGKDAQKFIKAGAHFIVSPIMKPAMAKVCKEYKKLWIPGCATLTEIVNAKEAGAEVIKIFPASILGPTFISSVLPVVPGLKLMPTGGVEPAEENIKVWFKAGVHCVGVGSQLFSKEAITDVKALTKKIAETLSVIKKVRL